MRPIVAGVEIWCSIALYETYANSMNTEPAAISTSPSHK